MIHLRASSLFMIFVLFSLPAAADLELVDTYVPNAELAGEARMRVLVWDVFDAELYAPEGEYDPSSPFALSLSYLREFTSEQIVARSMSEIERQGPLDSTTRELWRGELAQLIPDVEPGMTIVGVRDATGRAHFYLGQEKLGTVEDPNFSRKFFNIWLGAETSNPAFQRAIFEGQDL